MSEFTPKVVVFTIGQIKNSIATLFYQIQTIKIANMKTREKVKVEAIVNAPLETTWKAWNTPEDIMKWNTPDPSWHCPSSQNDLRVNGKFNNRMEAKDGSFGFDFQGTYNKVDLNKEIAYTLEDGRAVCTLFSENGGKTRVETSFDPEKENDPEFQRQGWQAILDNFVKHVESKQVLD